MHLGSQNVDTDEAVRGTPTDFTIFLPQPVTHSVFDAETKRS